VGELDVGDFFVRDDSEDFGAGAIDGAHRLPKPLSGLSSAFLGVRDEDGELASSLTGHEGFPKAGRYGALAHVDIQRLQAAEQEIKMALFGRRQGSPGGAKLGRSVVESGGGPSKGLAGLQFRERGRAQAIADALERGNRARRFWAPVVDDEWIPVS